MNFMHYYRPIVIRTTGKAACLKCTLHTKNKRNCWRSHPIYWEEIRHQRGDKIL